jgi:hypothetical protein
MILKTNPSYPKSEYILDLEDRSFKYIDQITFLTKNSHLFHNKTVLELGCGFATIKKFDFLNFASYTGIDIDKNSNADYFGSFEDPNIYEETGKSPFDIIIAFNQIPQNLLLVHENLSDTGYFFHSSSPFWYESNKIEDRINNYFHILDKSLEKICYTDANSGIDLTISSYFLTCKKKDINPYN